MDCSSCKGTRLKNILVSRYADLNSIDVIKRLSRLEVDPISDLHDNTVEQACLRISNAWKSTFVPTQSVVEVMRVQIECAQAHASVYFQDPKSLLTLGTNGAREIEPYFPTCLTGLAGIGKSHLQHALVRLLCNKEYTIKLDGYKALPLTTFTRLSVKGQKSISGVLRPLCKPEIANSTARTGEPNIIAHSAAWQYLTGGCLFCADEMQFLAQSTEATTLITRVLLALTEVRTPWFFSANYSLGWKLLARPPEATQRLLSRPIVLIPDAPGSKCWGDLLEAYARAVPGSFGFDFKDRRFELWNYTAGIKRELVSLLTHAYRLCRLRGAWEVKWDDVDRAYSSMEYSTSRSDVNLLIAHAAQGGTLRQDLRCPFVDEASVESVEGYKVELRNARAKKVLASAIESSMTVGERHALKSISNTSDSHDKKGTGSVVKLRRPSKPSLADLQQAGRDFKNESSTKLAAPPQRPSSDE